MVARLGDEDIKSPLPQLCVSLCFSGLLIKMQWMMQKLFQNQSCSNNCVGICLHCLDDGFACMFAQLLQSCAWLSSPSTAPGGFCDAQKHDFWLKPAPRRLRVLI